MKLIGDIEKHDVAWLYFKCCTVIGTQYKSIFSFILDYILNKDYSLLYYKIIKDYGFIKNVVFLYYQII